MINVNSKGLRILSLIVVSLLLVMVVSGQGGNPTKDPEFAEQSKKYGANIDGDEGFLSIEDSSRRIYLELYMDEFIEGMGKGEEFKMNVDKLMEGWFNPKPHPTDSKKDLKFSDDTKNRLFRRLVAEDKEVAKKVINKAIEKERESTPGFYHEEINSFEIGEGMLERLSWEGNKLGFVGKSGELSGWLDFDDVPAFLKDVEIKRGKIVKGKFVEDKDGKVNRFFVTLENVKDGKAKTRTIDFSEGSVDDLHYFVDKNGHRFGANHLGIDKINYDQETGNLKVDYYDLNGDLESLEVSKDDLRGAFESLGEGEDKSKINSLKDLMDDKRFREFYKSRFGEDIDAEGIGKIYDDIQELKRTLPKGSGGGDLELPPGLTESEEFIGLKKEWESFLEKIGERAKGFEVPTSNLLNVGQLRLGEDTGSISLDYNSEGGLDVRSSGGSVAVSTNVNDGVGVVLGANEDGNEGEYFFNNLGELEGHRNTLGHVIDDKSKGPVVSFKSGDKVIGTKIVKSSIADAINKGDINKLIETIEHQSGIVEAALLVQDPEDVTKAMKILQEQIGNKNIDAELRTRMLEAVGVLQGNLESRGQTLVSELFGSKGLGAEGFLENSAFNKRLGNQIEQQTRDALNNLVQPENIGTVIDYMNNKDNLDGLVDENDPSKGTYGGNMASLISESLKDFEEYPKMLESNKIVGKVLGHLNSKVLAGDKAELEIEITNYFNKLTSPENVRSMLEGNVAETSTAEIEYSVRDLLENGDIGTVQEREIIVTNVGTLFDRIDRILKAQGEALGKSLKSDLSRVGLDSKYEDNLFIDTDLGEVIYSGTAPVEVDTKMILRRVEVDDEGAGNFKLTSHGNEVFSVRDGETYGARNGQAKVENIVEMINKNKPGEVLKVVSDHRSYQIIDPSNVKDVRSVVDLYGNADILTGKRAVGVVPVLTHHTDLTRNINIEDIGFDPEASLKFTVIAEPGSSGLFGFLLPGLVNREASKKISQSLASLDLNSLEYDQTIDEYFGVLDKPIEQGSSTTRRDLIRISGKTANDFLEFANNNNINIPQRGAIQDLVAFSNALGKEKNVGVRETLKPLIDFAAKQNLFRGSVLEIGNDAEGVPFVSMSTPSGSKNIFKAQNPSQEALLRYTLREAVVLKDRFPDYFELKLKNDETRYVLIQDKAGRRLLEIDKDKRTITGPFGQTKPFNP